MFINRSFWRKVAATVGAAVGFVFVYETTIRDSRNASRQGVIVDASSAPQRGSQLKFTATAYCKGATTASGVGVRTGIAAADPMLLPVGTVVRLDTPESSLDGIWTIMDTGPAVQGRIIDLYLWSCHDALRFGRRPIQLTVLRLGWNPQHSDSGGRVDDLFRQRELQRALVPIPSRRVDPAGTLVEPVAPAVEPIVPAIAPLPVPIQIPPSPLVI
jgi:3D (Asp-Asp-Asp) domain-containing protein